MKPSKKKTPSPLTIYRTLMEFFGPQGWWPSTLRGKTRPEYQPGVYRRETDRERFEVCAGAILTQNTAWTNVEKAIAHLHEAGVRTPEDVSGLETAALAEHIRPSGYYKQKAARLKDFAAHLCREHGGSLRRLFERPLAEAREELLSLKGIGPETADSMLLYAGGHLSFVVDAYTFRMGERLGWFAGKKEYHAAQRFLVEALPRTLETFNEFHALIVALGKDYCRTRPRCEECPLRGECPHGGRREH